MYSIVDLIYSFSEHLLSVHSVIDVALGIGGIQIKRQVGFLLLSHWGKMQGDKHMGCFQTGNFQAQKWDRKVVRQ